MSSNAKAPDARPNVRPLDAIAVDIHKVARNSVWEIGDLLTEARAACEPGTWLRWLKDEFEWSDDTADRYMKVVELGTPIPQFAESETGEIDTLRTRLRGRGQATTGHYRGTGKTRDRASPNGERWQACDPSCVRAI